MTADRDNLERLRGAGWVLGMMADRWQMQVMADTDRLDSEKLRVSVTDRQTDWTFAIVESVLPLKNIHPW